MSERQDLNDIFYFSAVVSHGGFSAAARALNVPKSKLSKHVMALERRLGVRLIERSTRRFQVTDLGREFHRHCEAILAGVEEAEALVARAKSEPHGILRISCPVGLAPHVMAHTLPDFMKAYPRLRLQVMVTNRRIDLIEERVDIAFRIRSKLDADASLTMRTLGHSQHLLVASPAFVSAHSASLTIEGLGELPTLSFNENAEQDTWHLKHKDGRTMEVTHRPVLCCGDFAIITEAAAAGLGVALVPDNHCTSALKEGRLVQILPEWMGSDGIVHLVFTSKRGLLPATRAFIDHAVKTLPGLLAQAKW